MSEIESQAAAIADPANDQAPVSTLPNTEQPRSVRLRTQTEKGRGHECELLSKQLRAAY